ncbi:MAG: hypothetical protein A2W33_00115 [Chloroflexi bacterium RBG_16_52_11]|nr:MAG: hypothetical protein A2W33_00115 [Chloroflexi bacterium RBG_16_52_11]
MNIIQRGQIPTLDLAGRKIQTLAGKGAFSPSTKMTMGFARYSDDSGPMEPHQHAEEICYVLSAKDCWVEKGDAPDRLGEPFPLEAGLTMHIPPLEWHVFRWEAGGHLDIIFFYGQVDHIRPEDGVR